MIGSRGGSLYRIRVEGHLDDHGKPWFEGFTIAADSGDAVLTARVADPSALHGLPWSARDLGVPLLSISRIGHDPSPDPSTDGRG